MRKEGVMLEWDCEEGEEGENCGKNGGSVERLDCKRPILWLASSKILTPQAPPPSPQGECVRTGAGGGHTRWMERGVNILEDARHSSVLYSTYVTTLWAKVRGKEDVAGRHGCSDR